MRNPTPLVSLVTPNYNYASFVGQTITSVLDQDWEDIEHIIVDDGSTDNSVEVIRSFQQKAPARIKLIEQRKAGQTAAINTGLRSAKGDFVGWINSDDTYCRNVMRTVVSCFLENPDVDVVFGDVNVVDMQEQFIYRIRHLNFDCVSGCLLGFATISTSNAVFWRRSLLDSVGYLDERLRCNMDGEFFSRLMRNRKVKRLAIPLANFRKQAETKAAIGRKDWDSLVQVERRQELLAAYSTLWISKLVPFQHNAPLRAIYRLKRIMMRALRGHYLLQSWEKYKFSINRVSPTR